MKSNLYFRSYVSRLSSRWRNGFSLVEVTIATGIASMGIVTLLSLLPSGLNMFRDAMNTTISAQIAQRLIKEAVQTDYDTLVGVTEEQELPPVGPVQKEWRYFTDEGVELPSNRASEAIFHAYMRVMPATDLPASAGVVGNSSLATVTVQVALNPSNRNVPLIPGAGSPLSGTIDPLTKIPFVTYTSHVAKIK